MGNFELIERLDALGKSSDNAMDEIEKEITET